jgi:dihydrofolate reductase
MGHDAQLLGRVTYEGFAAAWPQMTDEVGFAGKMNSMPKYVVSTTLTNPTWENTTVISGDVPARLAELKDGPGGDLLVAGSATLVRSLVEYGLLDELRLMTFPVVVGAGKKLFDTGPRLALELADVQRYDSGVVTLTYRK